jgi:hypothetical protein
MPKGYVIFTEDIRDEAQINAYARQAIRLSINGSLAGATLPRTVMQ